MTALQPDIASQQHSSPDAKVYVAGHRGMVGSAIVRRLLSGGVGSESLVLRSSSELDLRNQSAVDGFFEAERPARVFLAAAKVGGIYANDSYPADFIRDNLQIQTNVIDAAYRNGVKKLIFLGSSCIYPKMAPQPMPEDCLLTGELEPTNEWYAIAKIAGVKMCQAYRRQYGFNAVSIMPTNLYGPNDNFDLERSHVLPALIRKFHLAKLAGAGDLEAVAADQARYGRIPDDILSGLGLERAKSDSATGAGGKSPTGGQKFITANRPPKVILWGSGSPYREFLHVDDMADASVFIMNHEEQNAPDSSLQPHLYNVGAGEDITIRAVAGMVQRIVGFEGEVIWDSSKPDGTPRKLMDVSKLSALGWRAGISLEDGIRGAYDSYLARL
jgi:GDP-L-fucose synthase